MLATKDTLDSFCREVLEYQKDERSRRCDRKYVHHVQPLAPLTLYIGWSAFVDFALAVFGITLIWNLQMNKKTKVNIGAFLGLGIL